MKLSANSQRMTHTFVLFKQKNGMKLTVLFVSFWTLPMTIQMWLLQRKWVAAHRPLCHHMSPCDMRNYHAVTNMFRGHIQQVVNSAAVRNRNDRMLCILLNLLLFSLAFSRYSIRQRGLLQETQLNSHEMGLAVWQHKCCKLDGFKDSQAQDSI